MTQLHVKDFMIGQRVILNNKEIGTIVRSESGETRFGIWVYAPSKGYASDYSVDNIKPLPNGQL